MQYELYYICIVITKSVYGSELLRTPKGFTLTAFYKLKLLEQNVLVKIITIV